VAAFAVCLILTGCVVDKKEVESWQQDKQLVMQSVEQLQAQQKQMLERLSLAETQLADQKTASMQQHAAYASQKEQIAQLKYSLRRLQKTTAKLNESRKITKLKLDKKIEKIAQAIKPAEPVEITGSGGEDEKDHYTAAYLALKSGRYEEAIEKFRELLKTQPNGAYSDQAYYWLGESYLAQNNIPRAIGNFEWMVSNYPESTKHAVALLRLGIAYQSQGRITEARNSLQRLIKTHGDSPSAEEARVLLQSISEAQ